MELLNEGFSAFLFYVFQSIDSSVVYKNAATLACCQTPQMFSMLTNLT